MEIIGGIIGAVLFFYLLFKGFGVLGDTYKSGGIIGLIAVIGLVFLLVGFGL